MGCRACGVVSPVEWYEHGLLISLLHFGVCVGCVCVCIALTDFSTLTPPPPFPHSQIQFVLMFSRQVSIDLHYPVGTCHIPFSLRSHYICVTHV